MIGRNAIEARALADAIMEMVVARKASRVILLDLRGVSIIADYFIICSGESQRQLQGIVDEVKEKADALGERPRRVEGTPESGWILMDFGSVVLHIFDAQQREFFQLERLWSQARTLTVMP